MRVVFDTYTQNFCALAAARAQATSPTAARSRERDADAPRLLPRAGARLRTPYLSSGRALASASEKEELFSALAVLALLAPTVLATRFALTFPCLSWYRRGFAARLGVRRPSPRSDASVFGRRGGFSFYRRGSRRPATERALVRRHRS